MLTRWRHPPLLCRDFGNIGVKYENQTVVWHSSSMWFSLAKHVRTNKKLATNSYFVCVRRAAIWFSVLSIVLHTPKHRKSGFWFSVFAFWSKQLKSYRHKGVSGSCFTKNILPLGLNFICIITALSRSKYNNKKYIAELWRSMTLCGFGNNITWCWSYPYYC